MSVLMILFDIITILTVFYCNHIWFTRDEQIRKQLKVIQDQLDKLHTGRHPLSESYPRPRIVRDEE